MSWLNNIKRSYKFRCTNKGCGGILHKRGEDVGPECIEQIAGATRFCEICQKDTILEYAGFDNLDRIGISHNTQKESYDQNGRKAYKIGNTYMSKTKYDYLETGKIENQYTPSYRAELEKQAEKNEYLLKTETNQRRAQVSKVMKKLPDGEYFVK